MDIYYNFRVKIICQLNAEIKCIKRKKEVFIMNKYKQFLKKQLINYLKLFVGIIVYIFMANAPSLKILI